MGGGYVLSISIAVGLYGFFYVIAAYLYADLFNRTIKLRFSFFKSIARYLNIVRGGYLPARVLSQVRSLISGTGWGDSSKR